MVETGRRPPGAGTALAHRPASRALLWGLLAAGAFIATGCRGPECLIEFDKKFSYNVVKTPVCYPPEKLKLTAAQAQIIARWGPPDFFRFWWLIDGEFITSSDLSGMFETLQTELGQTKQTWIYTRRGQEIEFLDSGAYLESPVSEKLKLICKYGDPSNKKAANFSTRTGNKKETWIWYDFGIKIVFINDLEISRERFQASGRGTWRSK